MAHDPQARMDRLEPLQHRGRSIPAAVVDDDDLEGPSLILERRSHPSHGLLQVGLLVEGGHHRTDLHRRRQAHGAKPTRVKTVATGSRRRTCQVASCRRMSVRGWALGKMMASGWACAITFGQAAVRELTCR